MAVVQEAFDIPSDIMTKILTGEYKRLGGVVRVAMGPDKGQIVKHLDPVKINEAKQAESAWENVLTFVKKNKKGIGIAAVAAAAAFGGYKVYKHFSSKESKEVTEFRKALRKYIEAIRNGNMDVENIDELRGTIDKLKTCKDYDKITIQLSTEELDVLVNKIYEYTLKLAKDNDFELEDCEQNNSENTIINLQNILEVQKKIFQAA